MITASQNTAGDYYICGSVNNKTYVIKIDANAAPAWAKIYGPNNHNEGRALIESPYNNNELIVVGRWDDAGLAMAKGYFMSINTTNGSVNNMNIYGFNNGTHADDWFNCIDLAPCTNGSSSGYIVGGRAYDPGSVGNTDYKSWMIKLDPNGGVTWSTLIKPTWNGNPIEYGVMDVFERYNPNSEWYDYEYYGVSTMDAGAPAGTDDTLIVWRLDETGNNTGVLFPYEMKYPVGDGIGNTDFSAQIECVGDGTNAGDGFGAWSTDPTNSEHFFYKNYFNGINGCKDTSSSMTVYQGPGYISSPSPSSSNFNIDCQYPYFNLTSPSSFTNETTCWNSTVAGGGNRGERAANTTGLGKPIKNLETAIYPNPVSAKFVIKLNSEIMTGTIKIENALGQIVYQTKINLVPADDNEIRVDFEKLNLSGGTYYLRVDTGGKMEVQKLVYIRQ